MRKILFAIVLLGMWSSCCIPEQKDPFTKDDVTVVEFKDLTYPAGAQIGKIQGAVVVQAKLDGNGRVTDAEVLSGDSELAPPALANIKKWRFRPNARHSAIIVYNFEYLEGRCESHGSLFVLQPSNVARIIACSPAVDL